MKRFQKFISICLIIPLFAVITSFDVERGPYAFGKDLKSLVDEFESVIGEQEKCKVVLGELRYLLKEVRKYFNEHPEEEQHHKILVNDVKSFKSYAAALTNSGSVLINMHEFKDGCRLIGGSFTYLEKGEYCVDIVKHRVGKHLCYLAFNTDKENGKAYKIEYILDAPSMNKKGVMESVVLSGKLDVIVDNRNWTDERFMRIANIDCENKEW